MANAIFVIVMNLKLIYGNKLILTLQNFKILQKGLKKKEKGIMLLKLFSSFFRLYILRSNVPISVNFSVTDRCNFNCTHCDIPKRGSKELTTEEIFTIVDALDKAGTMRISLYGGEPLMRQDIGQIIDYIKSKKIIVNIVTNGALLKQKIDEIKNLDFILLSYDGSPQAQKNVRGEQAHDVVIHEEDADSLIGTGVVALTSDTVDILVENAEWFDDGLVFADYEVNDEADAGAVHRDDDDLFDLVAGAIEIGGGVSDHGDYSSRLPSKSEPLRTCCFRKFSSILST